MSEASDESTAGRRRKPRRAKAERELRSILRVNPHLARRTVVAATVLRLAPILLPICLRFTLDPIADRRPLVLLGRLWSPETLLLTTVAVGLIVAVIRAAAAGLFVATAGRYGHDIVSRLRVAMFEHILRLPVKYLDRRGCGRVLLRFMGDSDALRSWVSRTRPTVIADGVLLLALVAALAAISPLLAIAAGTALPVIGVTMWMLRPALYRRTLEARRLQAEFTGHIEARLRRKRQSTWLDRYATFRQATRDLAQQIARRNACRDRQAARIEAAGQLLAFGLLPLLLAGGIELLWRGELTMGKFVAATWLISHMMVTLHRMSRSMIIREKATVSIDRILRLLERTAERGRGNRQPALRVGRPVLECRDLVFADLGIGSVTQPWTRDLTGPAVIVLPREVRLSSFRDLLLGFAGPRSGTIALDGQQLDQLRIRSVRREIGWIDDDPLLVEGTIEANLLLGAPHLSREKMLKRIRRNDLGILQLDEWLRREVEPNGRNIAADDVLRISFLRAVLNRPRVLLVTGIGEISDGLRELVAYQLAAWANRRGLVLLGYAATLELQLVGEEHSAAAGISEASPPRETFRRSLL